MAEELRHQGSRSLLVIALLLTGCQSSTPLSHVSSTPSISSVTKHGSLAHPLATQGCGRLPLPHPGTGADEILSVNPAEAAGHRVRTYRLHVPSSYQDARPQALVLVLHGYGGTATGMEASTGFSSFADAHDFVVAYPQGLPDGDGGRSFWASLGPMDYGIDDVHYISMLLDDVQSKLCIDAHRIFVTGFSNGAGMSGLLACRLAGRLAAVAPVSGNFYALPGGCHPSRPLPILYVHGSADPLLLYQGTSDSAWSLPPVQQWLQEWAVRNGCRHGPIIFLHTSRFTGEQWTGCQGNAIVIHYRIEGGGHTWPAKLGNSSSLAGIWDFFQAHPLVG